MGVKVAGCLLPRDDRRDGVGWEGAHEDGMRVSMWLTHFTVRQTLVCDTAKQFYSSEYKGAHSKAGNALKFCFRRCLQRWQLLWQGGTLDASVGDAGGGVWGLDSQQGMPVPTPSMAGAAPFS